MLNINQFLQSILTKILGTKFLQYQHAGACKNPCSDCPERDKRIYENGSQIILPAHPHCDCFYKNVETKRVGTISELGINGPDSYLKMFGELPDYYITKEQAIEKYGWDYGKDLSRFAKNKMIGGNRYFNREHILPEKEGRIWFECDVDYKSGLRDSCRLYYSNDGLIFVSPDHLFGNVTVYFIE